jgi:RNA polymerase sigma factor (sigma-70 family)
MPVGQPRNDHRPPVTTLLPGGGPMTDDQLLEHFVTSHDEAAFETLVRRYGPMVLGVCRRVLRNPHDAEDAFQATFLVLVRKAGSISARELLGNWLYGVAYRTALDARAAAIRRQTRERQVHPLPEPAVKDHADPYRELRPLIDQELNRLPEKYRLPIVLCDLEGGTFRDVARQLGIPAGTFSGRLSAARGMLARRLARHGLTLSVAALAAALPPTTASACVPPSLVTATVDASMAATAGPGTAATVSANVASLAEGVLKAMWAKSQKLVVNVLLTVAILIGVAAVVVLVDRTPHDARAKVLPLDGRGRRVVWSPDGKTLLVVTKVEKTFLGIRYNSRGSAIRLWDVETGQSRQTLAESTEPGLAFQRVVFSGDGKTIAATVAQASEQGNTRPVHGVIKVVDGVIKLWDAKTLELKRTLTTDSFLICVALSPDGERVVGGDAGKKVLHVWSARTGTEERSIKTGDAQPWVIAFSPDGKTLAVGGQTADRSGEVQLWDARTWKRKHAVKQNVDTLAFSPDGKLLAVSSGGEQIRIWNVDKGELIASLKGHPRGQRSVAFSADSKTLAAGGPDGKIRVWDVTTGKLTDMLAGHTDEVYSVVFSPDGKTLASTSQDQTLRLWSMEKRSVDER